MLLIEKYPKFLSPSALKMFEKQPITFYLVRMAPEPLPREPQTYGAALGTAFDAYVKIHIMNNILFNADTIRERLLKDIFDPLQKEYSESKTVEELLLLNIDRRHADCIPLGKMIADYYVKTSIFRELQIVDIEYHSTVRMDNVPIYMKLDLIVKRADCKIPFDLKTTSSSPEPGYRRIFDAGTMLGSHKIWNCDINFLDINKDWNDQLYIYSTEIDPSAIKRMAMVHQVCISNKIRIAEYYAECNENNLHARYSSAWKSIQAGNFLKIDDRCLLECLSLSERWY